MAVVQTYEHIQDAFPSEGSSLTVVVQADDVTSPQVKAGIAQLEREVQRDSTLFRGDPDVEISPDRTLAQVNLPTIGDGTDGKSEAALDSLRDEIVPATIGSVDGVQADVSGQAAVNRDFNDAMISHAPYAFGFVIVAAFLLLLVTFRSLVIPIKAIVLNLLSVAASYGVLVLVFQHGWGEGLLNFEANGGITPWVPLFLFVVLFGLSMDYHVFILTRVREAFDGGMSTEDAVAHGIKTTAGVVTSAALVMVAVFSLFATLSFLPIKQMGVGLAVAVLIDATIVRAVLLPATMKLLGDRNWWLPKRLGWLPKIEHEPEIEPARA
jgi:RND superfamily putative drug exporter